MRIVLIAAVFAAGCLDKLVPLHSAPNPSTPTPENPTVPANDGGSDAGSAPTGDLGTYSLFIEGETGELIAPMATVDNLDASGGKYISLPPGQTGGKATFAFNMPEAANVAIWGRVIAPADTANSFHLSIDVDTIDDNAADGLSTIWDLPVSTTWVWAHVNTRIVAGNTDVVANLAAGTHQLYVSGREAATQLDRLLITADLNFQPTN